MVKRDVLREATVTLTLAPEMELEARECACKWAESIAMSTDKVEEVGMAVVEACINAIEHSKASDRHLDLTLSVLGGPDPEILRMNCAALPEALLESELFGIEGGVATGVRARVGKFELAHGGTLFLDEIADLETSLQVKLLRALQEREIVRVGAHQPVAVDVRVVAATHQPLESLIREGRFREDLYYRLRGVDIDLPPLRERRQDIPHLVRYFAERFCAREGLEVPSFDRGALAVLLGHDYPGNVRELQNLVEGAVSLADGQVDAQVLSSLLGSSISSGPQALDLKTVERRHIARVLQLTSGNKSEAARLLGVDRRTLGRKGF